MYEANHRLFSSMMYLTLQLQEPNYKRTIKETYEITTHN